LDKGEARRSAGGSAAISTDIAASPWSEAGLSVAVFDIGKTNVKLSVVRGEDGQVLETLSTPNVTLDGPPYRHCDLVGLEAWLMSSLGALSRRHRLEGLVACGHGSAGVLVDAHGPVMPMIDYEQPLPAAIADSYRRQADRFDVRGSAIMHGATHQARQLLWLEHDHRQAFDRARWYLGLPQYWAFRLCGVPVSEVTILAAQSHLWNAARAQFAPIVERRGWQRLMPPVVPSHRRIGTIRAELAARHDIPANLAILAGIHDSSANRYRYQAAGLDHAAVLSTGTWLVGLSAAFDPSGLREEIGMTMNADVSGTPVAGALVMGGREYDLVAGEARSAPVAADDIARIVAGQTFAVPSFGRDDGLFPGSAGRGHIVGPEPLTASQKRALALLYAALLTDACLAALDATGDVVLDGSFVREPLYGALVAALGPQRAVRYNLEADGIAAGAALLFTHETRHEPVAVTLRRPEPMAIDGLAAYRARWYALAQGADPAQLQSGDLA
jgi:sugar (pentulose or hexulose) kinase